MSFSAQVSWLYQGCPEYLVEMKLLCFCGNCFTSPLHRLSDWATSQYWILREVLSITRELARKSFLGAHSVTAGYHLSGQHYQGMWSAEALTCWTVTPSLPALSPPEPGLWQKGRSGHMKKKDQKSFRSPYPFRRYLRTLRLLGLIMTSISN